MLRRSPAECPVPAGSGGGGIVHRLPGKPASVAPRRAPSCPGQWCRYRGCRRCRNARRLLPLRAGFAVVPGFPARRRCSVRIGRFGGGRPAPGGVPDGSGQAGGSGRGAPRAGLHSRRQRSVPAGRRGRRGFGLLPLLVKLRDRGYGVVRDFLSRVGVILVKGTALVVPAGGGGCL